MALLATSLACARALAHPASSPAGISVADADAHLRAVQASADGFAIARAILGAADEATETRVVGATMLRAKARTDGFAIAPDAAAAMTRELLDLLRGPDACTALGPHLAALAAAVAAAGGAETLGALVDEAVAYAAPDARGGWPTRDEVKNGARAATVGPGAHAAVALLAACAEESVHRPRRGAGGAETAAAARDRVDDVVFVLDAVAATDRAGWCAEEGSDGASTMIVPPWTFPADAPRGYRRGDDALLRAPLRHALPEALNVAARRCLCLWIPAGIALSELATRRGGSLLAATLAAVFEEGDEAAAEATETALASVDPLPGRDDAAALVASAAEAFASAANRDGVDVFAASFPPEIRLAATRVVAALALAEPKAFAATPGEGGSRATSAFLLRAIERAEPRVARVALASLRGRAGGVLEALRRTRRPELEGTCERAIGAVLTRRANGAALAWLRERVEAADRRAREAEGTDDATRDAVEGGGGPVDAFVARGAERRSRWREVADAARDELDGAVVRALEAAPGELADAEEEASLASDLDDALARVRAVAGNAPFFETVRRFLLDRPGEYAVGQMNPNPPGENDALEFRRTAAALEAIGACGSSESFDAAADRACRDALARATATTERAAAANPELASPLLTSYARAAREVGVALALRDPEGVPSRGVDALARTLVAAVFGVAFEGGGGVGPAGNPHRPSAASLAAASAAAAGALAALFDRAAAVARALDWRHTPASLADAEALRVALAHACETTRRFAVEGAGYAAAAAAQAAEGDPNNVHRSADAPSGVVAPFFFPSARDVSLVSSRAFAFAVALERRVETSTEDERELRDRAVPDLGLARVRAAIRAAAAGVADAAASFPTVSSSASAETLFLDAAALAPLAALEAWARSGAPSGLLASGDADGERLVARAVGASEAAALKIIADARVVPSAAGNRDAPLRDAAFARIRGTWSGVATAASVLHAAGPRRHEYAARAAETARHLTLTSAGGVSPFIGAALALSADLLAGVAPAAADDAFDARVRRPIADVIDSTAATLTLRPDADPDVVEALFHAAKAEARARAARMGGSGSDDAPLGVVGSSPATTKLALATIRRGAAVGARLAAIRFAEATFAAPVDLTIDRSDPAKTPANPSTLPVDGFASGALLPASFFALAKNLAALAGEAEDPAFLEPIANALWTASDSARRVGAESALASALVAALSGAADAEACEPPAGARFASAAEAEGAAFAFARGVATRTSPHPARRLAELVAAFGLACRGQGPIAAVVELQ